MNTFHPGRHPSKQLSSGAIQLAPAESPLGSLLKSVLGQSSLVNMSMQLAAYLNGLTRHGMYALLHCETSTRETQATPHITVPLNADNDVAYNEWL